MDRRGLEVWGQVLFNLLKSILPKQIDIASRNLLVFRGCHRIQPACLVAARECYRQQDSNQIGTTNHFPSRE
jgi:hypothetical protein